MKAIGIDNEEEIVKYKITTIEELIEKHGKLKLEKILRDPLHTITKSLEERESITRKNFPFLINKCRTEKYQNSFLQQFLRKLEKDGLKLPSNSAKAPPKQKSTNENAICEICKKTFKNKRVVNTHKRMKHKN